MRPLVIKELPNTKAGHMILLDAGTAEMLINHREHQADEKRLIGDAYQDDGWIFCRPDGTPHHPERFSRQQETYNKANPDEPIPSLKLHGLRHTWATLALQEGIDIHIVSDRLDHTAAPTSPERSTPTSPVPCSPTPPTAWRRGSSGAPQTPQH